MSDRFGTAADAGWLYEVDDGEGEAFVFWHEERHRCPGCDGLQAIVFGSIDQDGFPEELVDGSPALTMAREQGLIKILAMFVCEECRIGSVCGALIGGKGVTCHVQMAQ